jgi:hypothetical protein
MMIIPINGRAAYTAMSERRPCASCAESGGR